MDLNLNLGNENDWWKATLIMLMWAAAITCNWYFALQG